MRILLEHHEVRDLPAVIEPLIFSSYDAYAPLIVAILQRFVHRDLLVRPPLAAAIVRRVTMLWIAISGSKGPGP